MTNNIQFRVATLDDASAISHLITESATEFILDAFEPEARRIFLHSITACSITKYLKNNYCYHIAEQNKQLLAVIGIRNNTHLYHLFVDKSAHKKGMGAQLWEMARTHCLSQKESPEFTVNSFRDAIAFYNKLGFVATGPEFSKMGIVATPMRWINSAH